MKTKTKLLLLILFIILLIQFRKRTTENYDNQVFNLIQNDKGKLFLEDIVTVSFDDKIITIPRVELDTGSSKFIVDKETSAKLLENKDETLCEKGGWGENCIPYTYTSRFSGHIVNSKFYKGEVAIGDNKVTMAVGTNDKDFKYYSILGMSYNTGYELLNFLSQYYKSRVPRFLTFKYNNLDNQEGGTFHMNKPVSKKMKYITYLKNNRAKFLLKIKSMSVDGQKVILKYPYALIDTGAENTTLPESNWEMVGSPDKAFVEMEFIDDFNKSFENTVKISNNTPMRAYDPYNVTLNHNLEEVPYILVGKFLMQNMEVSFDIKKQRIGFSL